MKLIKAVLRVLSFLLVLESVFIIHEYGHLREFQKQGIPVEEFSLGIGSKIYQYQTDSFAISLRAIPIMAYVKTTEDGGKLFQKKGSLTDKLIVYFAGVRNNFLVAWIAVFFLQVLGWRKGNLSTKELLKEIVITPLKIILRFFTFLIGCLTWGRVNNLINKFLLSTGGINPSKLFKKFIYFNLVLGFLNLMPVFPSDGGHILKAILLSGGIDLYTASFSKVLGILIFVLYYTSIKDQDMRLFKVDDIQNKKEDQVEEKMSWKWRIISIVSSICMMYLVLKIGYGNSFLVVISLLVIIFFVFKFYSWKDKKDLEKRYGD